jgi:hypothetical protein
MKKILPVANIRHRGTAAKTTVQILDGTAQSSRRGCYQSVFCIRKERRLKTCAHSDLANPPAARGDEKP